MVDGSGLENRQGASPRGFESHPLRQSRKAIGEKRLVIGLRRIADREPPSSQDGADYPQDRGEGDVG